MIALKIILLYAPYYKAFCCYLILGRSNEEFGEIRTVIKNGEPWFVAKDVCCMFGDSNHNRSIKKVEDEDKTCITLTDSMGRSQQAKGVNESGLYALLFSMQPQRSNKNGASDAYPIAVQERIEKLRAFKRWITHEVIPSIRRHGAYMTPDTLKAALSSPEALIEILTALKNEQETNVLLHNENALLTQQNLEWDYRAFINAAVRRYAQTLRPKYGDQFAYAWNLFKKELLYQHDINLKSRLTKHLNRTGKKTPPATLDLLTDEEVTAAASTIVALCREARTDISDLLANISTGDLAS